MKRTILFTLLGMFAFLVSAQEIPELRKKFFSSEKDRLNHAAELRRYYFNETPDSIFSLGVFLIQKGIEKENVSWLNYGKMISSTYYYEHGKSKISIRNLQDCISYYEQKRDYENLADAQNLMGLSFLYELKNTEATNWFLKSLETAMKLDENNESYMAQTNLAEVFMRQGKFDLAEKELNKYIEKVKKQKLYRGLRKAYLLMGKLYFAKEQAASGIRFYEKALKLAEQNGDKMGLSSAYNSMGIAFFQRGNLEDARINFEKALKIRLQTNHKLNICESYYNLGEYYSYMENYSEAIAYYQKELDLAQETGFLAEQADALLKMAEVYELQRDYRQAYHFSLMYAEKQDKIIQQVQQKDDLLTDNYEVYRNQEKQFHQKIRENRLLKRIQKSDTRSYILFGISVLSVLILLTIALKRKSV